MCRTCIYRPDQYFWLAALEAEIADPHMSGFFRTYRACHHVREGNVVCAGFWRLFKHHFTLGQLAQRLGWVRYVRVDTLNGDNREGRS
jgi:hypothetical protein